MEVKFIFVWWCEMVMRMDLYNMKVLIASHAWTDEGLRRSEDGAG